MAVIVLNEKPKASKKKHVRLDGIFRKEKAQEYANRRMLLKAFKPYEESIEQILAQMKDQEEVDPRAIGEQLDLLRKNNLYSIEKIAEQIADKWVSDTNITSRQEFISEMEKKLGIDVSGIFQEDFNKELDILRWEAERLIKTIPEELTYLVSQRVLEHYKGIPMPQNRTLTQQIREEFKVSHNRAKVLARDQTHKLITGISAIRQQEVGIDMYEWGTMKDKRVVGAPGGKWKYNPKNDKHKNHYIMQGKVCRWDNPTVYSDDEGKTWKKRTAEMPKNHPADDIMCRCIAFPIVDIEKLKVGWME